MDNYNQSSVEKSEGLTIWSISTENQRSSSPVAVKSYTCTFCNKGFSSAQALGGHMNIHRKDRAKLHHENILSLDLAISPNPADRLGLELVEESTSCNPKSPSSLSVQGGAFSSPIKDSGNCHRDDEGSELQPSSRSIRKELDLELRLGPEPNEISTTRNTREFF